MSGENINVYCTEIVPITINENKFHVHKGVLSQQLVTSDVSQSAFTGIHEYIIDGGVVTPSKCSRVIKYLYTNDPTVIDVTDIAFYIFFDKYWKDRTILDIFTRRNELVSRYNWLKKWVATGDSIDNVNVYNFLGLVVSSYVKNVYQDVDYCPYFPKNAQTSQLKNNTISLKIISPDKFTLHMLQSANNAGHNIWDTWALHTNITEDELKYYEIDLDDVPDKYIGEKK